MDELLTTQQAAAYLVLSPRTLEKWRVTGEGPPFVKLGRRVAYRREDLREWVESRRRASTSDPGQINPHIESPAYTVLT